MAERARDDTGLLSLALVVSALGYFVDLYDIVTFTVVRVASLADLGVAGSAATTVGIVILDAQQAGLILGGVLWGVLADRRGRVRVLFASIALYSVANLANAFVTDVVTYGALRFLAGVGLAGELGIAVTLVTETLSPERRSWGPVLITVVGVCGAITAALTAGRLPWRVVYLVGGALGLALLVLRVRLVDSRLFRELDGKGARRGDLRLFLASPRRLATLGKCVLVGVPNWFVSGVMVVFAPEIGRALHASGPVTAATAVIAAYVGYGLGVVLSGSLSQALKDRWWVTLGFLSAFGVALLAFALVPRMPPAYYYAVIGLASMASGYITLTLLMTAELFGTNLRATATASFPNLVRGSVIVMTIAFGFVGLALGHVMATLLVGLAAFVLALAALRGLPETYGRDLDFVET